MHSQANEFQTIRVNRTNSESIQTIIQSIETKHTEILSYSTLFLSLEAPSIHSRKPVLPVLHLHASSLGVQILSELNVAHDSIDRLLVFQALAQLLVPILSTLLQLL